jgi:nitrate/TMAO reductase-like tetraheme cytochrome c subunit
MYVPPGHRRVKILKATMHAREELPVGMLAVLDTDTATKLVKAKAAEFAGEEPRALTRTTCPKCHSAVEYPEMPEAHERWAQCKNPQCNHGWMR